MLSFTNSFIVYQIEFLIAYSVFSGVGEKRFQTTVVLLIGTVIFSIGAVVNVLFSNSAWINLVTTLVINFLFAKFGFKLSSLIILFYSVMLDFFSAVFETITIVFISTVLEVGIYEYNSNGAILILEVIISKTLYFLLCLMVVKVANSLNRTSVQPPTSFYIYPISTVLCTVFFHQICAYDSLSDRSQLQLAYLSVALLISTILLFLTYQHNLEKENEYLQAKSELDNLETKREYYEVLEHQNQQLMMYAHDAKNHLAAIQNLSGDPSIHEYVENLSEQLKSYTKASHSGNRILDVIISRYSSECEMRGIHFEYDVKACNLSGMEDIDVVAVLGNLMDNALSAAEHSAEKWLSLETTWRNTYSVLIVSNSCDAEPVARGNKLITTKKESRLHGYGLRSVRRTLKKYQGDYSWEYNEEKHQFVVTAMIGSKTS